MFCSYISRLVLLYTLFVKLFVVFLCYSVYTVWCDFLYSFCCHCEQKLLLAAIAVVTCCKWRITKIRMLKKEMSLADMDTERGTIEARHQQISALNTNWSSPTRCFSCTTDTGTPSPDRTTRSQIDYVLVSKQWRQSVNNARTWLSADCDSDRNLVLLTMQI